MVDFREFIFYTTFIEPSANTTNVFYFLSKCILLMLITESQEGERTHKLKRKKKKKKEIIIITGVQKNLNLRPFEGRLKNLAGRRLSMGGVCHKRSILQVAQLIPMTGVIPSFEIDWGSDDVFPPKLT
uniref:Uncharacterized protein n=1 Tax=Cacopsylla melanoneura TaxID=428564 RepID=A0A8D9A4Q4_9HEMI